MTEAGGPTVSDAGENALLERIARRIGAGDAGEVWAGDDAAVTAPPAGPQLTTTDSVVEGLDFDVSYCSGYDLGWKAIAVNASDIASMCGRPAHAVAAVVLRNDVPLAFFDELLEGLVTTAARWGARLVGGDLSGGSEIVVTVTMTGAPVGKAPVLRSGARPGDALCVTGTLGAARGGLEVLRRGMRGPEAAALAQRQRRPRARVEEAAALAPLGPTAMIDVSDGLAVDLGRLLDASGAGAEVALDALPVEPTLKLVDGLDPVEAAVLGGEDYELLFTIGEERVDDAAGELGRLGTKLSRIGTISSGPAVLGQRPLESWKERGWEHLRNR